MLAELIVISSLIAQAARIPAPDARAAVPAVDANATSSGASAAPPGDYVIGPDDVLSIVFWRDKELSGDVTVRPDGRISLPLLNDIDAAGLTPEQLCKRVTEAASRFIQDPNPTVLVKEIKSRKVFITGQVARPGVYPLNTPITVLQLIATAGGLAEFADAKHITISRRDSKGTASTFTFNYRELMRGKNLTQNLVLKPGDTVIVP